MGVVKGIFLTSVLIALTGVLMQKYSPDTVDTVVDITYPLTVGLYSYLEELSHKLEKPLGFDPLKTLMEYKDLDKFRADKKEGVGQYTAEKKEKSQNNDGLRVMTADELKKFDGKSGETKIYLSFLGNIFDVTEGIQYYGPDGGYSFFSGCDASRAFVTGDFTPAGLIDDVEGLSPQDYLGMENWLAFYRSDYKTVGKLAGRFYDSSGAPTEYHRKLDSWIAHAKTLKENEDNLQRTFPPCNSEWSAEQGSRVWCTKKSGGIDRSWTGVPRRLYTPGKTEPRCACIKNFGKPSTTLKGKGGDRGDLDHPHLMEYPDCPPKDTSCVIPKKMEDH